MAKTDNTVLNVALGVFLAPFSGAYYGYKYAQQKRELYKLDPSAERGWDGTVSNVLIGIIGGQLSGLLFGYNSAKLEMKIEELKEQQAAATAKTANASAKGTSPELAPELANSKWRDRVTAEAQQQELAR